MRFLLFSLFVALSVLFLALGAEDPRFFWPLIVTAPLSVLGAWDLLQRRHSLMRNYPIVGHFRWLLEGVRGQIHQYLIESDLDGRPFNREARSLVYARAKDVEDVVPFGTEVDVYAPGYEWINHSIQPAAIDDKLFRVDIGGPACTQPYSSSVLNISAMSFGALGASAVRALNRGAAKGTFAHDTGEGGISAYHREAGGDLILEIGTGYFGCRAGDGSFDEGAFAEKAQDPQVKMIEVKLSQGAKPGHGGILPGAKVTPEIAAARDVPLGVDCISPPRHTAFSTPIEFVHFLARLREESGGKPVGFKLCVGHGGEFLAICKAALEAGIAPDFVVVDGAEGGTAAAPLEFADNVGMPLREGLIFVTNALIGTGLRDAVQVGASGKVISGFDMAANMALGADWCNSARGFMFALGCVQSQKCHTNKCPTGVATQEKLRQRGLVVADKAERVCEFHRETVRSLADVVSAAGLNHSSKLTRAHLYHRTSPYEFATAEALYPVLEPNALIGEPEATAYARDWGMARAGSFHPEP